MSLPRIMFEIYSLMKQSFSFLKILKTACRMSFISMIGIETAMNLNNHFLNVDVILIFWVIPITLVTIFLTPCL